MNHTVRTAHGNQTEGRRLPRGLRLRTISISSPFSVSGVDGAFAINFTIVRENRVRTPLSGGNQKMSTEVPDALPEPTTEIKTNPEDEEEDLSGTAELSPAFLVGLQKRKLSLDQVKATYRYCGGDKGKHRRYFQHCRPFNRTLPPRRDLCICGKKLLHNYYIANGPHYLILCKLCIKSFEPTAWRCCEVCGRFHRHGFINRCTECQA